MKKTAKFILLFVLLVSLFSPSESVYADIAPPPEIELGGLQTFQDTEVQMVYERVEMELGMFNDENSPDQVQNRVIVNAYFVMKNLGLEDENMQAVFPSQSAPVCHGNTGGDSFTVYYILDDSFEVSIDGSTVPTFMVEAPYGVCEDFPWLAFDVTFPVKKEVLVKLSYVMETWEVDYAQNIDYILDTGAGWKGNIGRGYVILKFPYAFTSENILSNTTEGYQFLYNEIFWSFQDLEPTPDNNIHISIVSPNIWLEIRKLRNLIEQNPGNPEAWLDLTDIYHSIAFDQKGDNIRENHYLNLIEPTYEQAIAQNPNSAELHAKYAEYKLYLWSPRLFLPISETRANELVVLLNRALALDPKNETAQNTLSGLRYIAPFITFTPPPPIPPTATSQFTSTPSITPSATITPIPTETPVVFTVVHTKIVNEPKVITATPEPEIPTAKPSPTEIPAQDEPQKESSTTPMIFGSLILFAAGIGVGAFWHKRRMSS